ncbi:MAG: peptidylprolyl isomerase [Sedimentisphaerales bacterium]|nr:peptidylprolyl isomerase [Sedimentisphaerales bacterium]
MALLVNGERIEDSAILKEVERLRPDYEKVFAQMNPAERENQLLDWSKENLIERILLQQEVKNKEPKIPENQLEVIVANLKKKCKEPQELYRDFDVRDDEDLKESIELIIRTERKLEKLLKNLPNPPIHAIRQYYDKNKEQFKSAEKIHLAHIVKYVNWNTDESAAYAAMQQAHNDLKNGAAFEIVAEKYTDCPDREGNLGLISKGQMAEEFEDVVFNLGVGQVSNIFRTRFGFHITKIYARYPAGISDFEEVKDQITKILKEQMQTNAIHEFIDGLKSNAKIENI